MSLRFIKILLLVAELSISGSVLSPEIVNAPPVNCSKNRLGKHWISQDT